MKIYIGADHAGFELKEKLKIFLQELGHEIEDKGAFHFDKDDDYPDFVTGVAEGVASEKGSFGVVLGGSGQGEAMCANRVHGVRTATFYGEPQVNQTDISGNVLDMIASTRMHNDANIISLGARFLTDEQAKNAIKIFLETKFSGDERHIRRIKKLN
jgi:ribose 5-phosphate isomerase B